MILTKNLPPFNKHLSTITRQVLFSVINSLMQLQIRVISQNCDMSSNKGVTASYALDLDFRKPILAIFEEKLLFRQKNYPPFKNPGLLSRADLNEGSYHPGDLDLDLGYSPVTINSLHVL